MALGSFEIGGRACVSLEFVAGVNDPIESLAIFGGAPLFSEPRPFATLAAPDRDEYVRVLRERFQRGSLDMGGESARALERSLAAFHQVDHCVAVTNACVALVMLMRCFADGRRGNVLIPAFSYSGLPHVVQWAGQEPRFCDVGPVTHALDRATVERFADAEATSVLAVCNVHDTSFIGELAAAAKERNLPIVFDSVNALGATHGGRPLGGNGDAEVFSLHATKVLNGFEGGYITTHDGTLASRLRQLRARIGAFVNELHAEMALLALEDLPSLFERNRAKYEAYATGLADLDGIRILGYKAGERYNYAACLIDVLGSWPLTRDETVTLLKAEGAATNAYYNPPLHRSSHCPPQMRVQPLPVAESLSTRFCYLPSGERTSLGDVERTIELLHVVSERGASVAAAMRATA